MTEQKKLRLLDLWPIGVLFILIIGQIALFTPAHWQTILVVIGLSYGQNISFTLASRARTRDNVMYHLCAVLLSTLVSFLTFRTILGPGSDFSLKLLLAYTAGTISGSLTGSYISMRIERVTGARADADPISKETAARNRKKAIRCLAGIVAIGWTLQFFFGRNENLLDLLQITALVFLPDMLYSMRTWIQNRNNDYLTLGVSLLNGVVDFFRWTFLIKLDMRWGIFVPYSTGGTAGSIAGSVLAGKLTRWVERITGTKISADAHVKKGEMKKLDYRPIWLLLGVLGVTMLLYPPKNLILAVPFVLATTGMQISFALVSRARNRNNALYHLVAAMCSNGMWFFVLHLVATMAGGDSALFTPYAIGTAIGGLIGVRIAMFIERKTGALADAFINKVSQPI